MVKSRLRVLAPLPRPISHVSLSYDPWLNAWVFHNFVFHKFSWMDLWLLHSLSQRNDDPSPCALLENKWSRWFQNDWRYDKNSGLIRWLTGIRILKLTTSRHWFSESQILELLILCRVPSFQPKARISSKTSNFVSSGSLTPWHSKSSHSIFLKELTANSPAASPRSDGWDPSS